MRTYAHAFQAQVGAQVHPVNVWGNKQPARIKQVLTHPDFPLDVMIITDQGNVQVPKRQMLAFPTHSRSGQYVEYSDTQVRAGDLRHGDLVPPAVTTYLDENGQPFPYPQRDVYGEGEEGDDEFDGAMAEYMALLDPNRMMFLDARWDQKKMQYALRFESSPHGKVYTTFVNGPDDMINFPGREGEFVSAAEVGAVSRIAPGVGSSVSRYGPYKNALTGKTAMFLHKTTRGRYPAGMMDYDLQGSGQMKKPVAKKYAEEAWVHPETGETHTIRRTVNAFTQPLIAEWAHWHPLDEEHGPAFRPHPEDPFGPGKALDGTDRSVYLERAMKGTS